MLNVNHITVNKKNMVRESGAITPVVVFIRIQIMRVKNFPKAHSLSDRAERETRHPGGTTRPHHHYCFPAPKF